MAEAMSYTAPSIEMSPIASILERRATGLRSADIGYDEERAETNSRACVGRTNPTYWPFLRRVVTYLRVTFKSRPSTNHLPPPEGSEEFQKLVGRIKNHPQGYPQLAAFFDCDSRKFLMCRSFMYSRIRHLLYRQDELAELQKDLLDQDKKDSSTIDGRRILTSRIRYEFRNDRSPGDAIINKIGPKLKEYDDLVERTIKFASLRAPDTNDLRGVKLWIEQEEPLSKEETKHLLGGTDFVALVEKQEECWLDNVVERALSKCLSRDSIFTSPEQRRISGNANLTLRSKHRIDVLIRIVLTITAASMLLGPSAVLYIVNGHNILKLLLIGAFTILFSAALHAFSKARRHENFAATSAYCAVLVTYLANFAPSARTA